MHAPSLPADSLTARVARNFFTHSGHVPLVLLILEALLARPGYFFRADPYVLLAAGLAQAGLMERLRSGQRPHPFLANLAGPLLYSLVEAALEGREFFRQWHHQTYWGFAIGFGALHWAQIKRGRLSPSLILIENIFRSAIPLVMYALFEARSKNQVLSLDVFFADRAHDFLAIVLLLLGVLLGFADVGLRRSMARVAELTARLRQYSEWSLGRGILNRAIADERVLSLQRVERAVLFMDIRGFTAWSERQTPETVVEMLNSYYHAADHVLAGTQLIKVKYTADEIMAVFTDAKSAIEAGVTMITEMQSVLSQSGLAAGCGVHVGPVVEGVLGAEGARAYDFIGDTVNTAQRLCDAAKPGELLVSTTACNAIGMPVNVRRHVVAKGKSAPIEAAVIIPELCESASTM